MRKPKPKVPRKPPPVLREQLNARRRARPIDLTCLDGVNRELARVRRACLAGEITPEQSKLLTRFLRAHRDLFPGIE